MFFLATMNRRKLIDSVRSMVIGVNERRINVVVGMSKKVRIWFLFLAIRPSTMNVIRVN